MDSSDQGVDERMINVGYYYYYYTVPERKTGEYSNRAKDLCEYTCEPVWPSGKALGW